MQLTITQMSPSYAIATFRNRAVDNSALEQQIVASHDSSITLRTTFPLMKRGNCNLQATPEVIFSDEAGHGAHKGERSM